MHKDVSRVSMENTPGPRKPSAHPDDPTSPEDDLDGSDGDEEGADSDGSDGPDSGGSNASSEGPAARLRSAVRDVELACKEALFADDGDGEDLKEMAFEIRSNVTALLNVYRELQGPDKADAAFKAGKRVFGRSRADRWCSLGGDLCVTSEHAPHLVDRVSWSGFRRRCLLWSWRPAGRHARR